MGSIEPLKCAREGCAPAVLPETMTVRCAHCGFFGHWERTPEAAIASWNEEMEKRLDVRFNARSYAEFGWRFGGDDGGARGGDGAA